MAERKEKRFGIAARLTAAFAGLAGLAAVAGAASSWFSMQSAEIVTGLGSKVLPTVAASMDFAQQSTVLVSEAPALASQTDSAALDEKAARLEKIQADQARRLTALRGMIGQASVLDAVQQRNDELAPKIGQLRTIAAERIAVRAKIQKAAGDALQHYQDLMDIVRPLQEAVQTAVDGELASIRAAADKPASETAEQAKALDADLTTLRVAMDVQASGNLAFGMLSAAANAGEDAASDIRSQYNWAEVYLGKALKVFGTSDDAKRIKPLVDALLEGGSGPDSLFTLRAREIEINGKITGLLGELVAASDGLAKNVKILVQTQEAASRTAVADSAVVTRQTLAVNAATSGLVMVAALLIGVFYVRRSVTRRLDGLARGMTRLAQGDRTVMVEASGHDEITDMAAAVQVFRQNLIRNDELAAEAARLAQEREVARNLAERERADAAARQAIVVDNLAGGLARLAAGDLTQDIGQSFSAEYEKLRHDFNAAMAQLRATIEQVIGNAETLRSGTTEIAGAADNLSRRTENQAASLEQTAAALGEVTGAIRKTAEGAAHARDVVGMAKQKAVTSGAVMQDAVAAMSAIEASSVQIGQIIGVVDEIAFQTNLLALNAGVEAARAGDAGRGFAVVASEVRALAQRSADAAKEIKGLVSASKSQVSRGVELVGQGGEALHDILEEVSEINTIVSDIARAANDQILGLDQVNVAVNQMDQVTQQNAAMVEETTAASHNLAREIEALLTLIGRFRVGSSVPPSRLRVTPSASSRQPQHVAAGRRTGGGALRKADVEAVADEGWTEF